MTGTSLLFLLLAIAALMIAAGAVEASIKALLELVGLLLRAVFANLGRLLVIGAFLFCLFLLLFHTTPPPDGPGVG